MSPQAQRSTLSAAIGAGVLALPAFAALAIGTVHAPTRTAVFLGSAALLLLVLVERLAGKKQVPVTIPTVALAVAATATALQLVPLPDGVVAVLSPAAYTLGRALGDGGALPLSLDPPATLAELAKLCAYLAFFTAAVIYASRASRRRQIVIGIAALATVVATIGLAQAALGVREVLFFYQPRAEWASFVRGTFVNPNHFGGLLCVGAPCALAIGLREPRLRWPAYLATVIMNVAVMLSLARASIAAALIGQALVFILDRLELSRGGEFIRSRAATVGTLLVAVVAALAIAMVAGRSRLAAVAAQTAAIPDELDSPLSKLNVWRSSAELVWEHPWTGVGRGAFEPAFTRVSQVGGHLRFQWVENGYLQTLVDWGVPVALLLLVLAGWGVMVARRRLREDPLALGAFAGIVALAVHEAADFAIELPGVALPALAVLATLFGRSSREAEAGRRRLRAHPLLLAVPLLCAVPAIAALGVPSAEADAARLAAMVRDPSVSTDAILAAGDEARRRHPSDYFVRLVVAQRLARELHPKSLAWLNQAMLLNPTHPGPHLMAAEVLAASGRKAQALVEYRLAAAGARDPRAEVWRYVAARYPSVGDLIAATPDETSALLLLGKWLSSTGRPADAEIVTARLLEKDPKNPRALEAAARAAIARGDAAAAGRHVAELGAVSTGPQVARLRVRERILAGELDVAARFLDADRGRDPAAFDLELELGAAYLARGKLDTARARLDDLSHWRLDRPARVRLHEMRAQLERLSGNQHQYQWEIEQRDRNLQP